MSEGICRHCVSGEILDGEPTGTMQGTAYLAEAPTPTQVNAAESGSPKRCLVLLSDIFGLPVKNCKIIADEVAKRTGYSVWIPDLFNGTPPVKPDQLITLMPAVPGKKIGILNILRLVFLLITRLPQFLSNRQAAIDARIVKFFDTLRKEKGYEKIGAFGYCLGGAAAVRLASTGLVDSVVVIHPGRTNIKQMKAMLVPVSFVCAEEDFSFKPDYIKQVEAVCKQRKESGGPDYEFKEYKGVVHGFASRPHMSIPAHKEAFEGALEQTINWLKKTV